MKKNHFQEAKRQRGVVLVIVTVAIGTILAFVALAIDVGYVMVTRNELQNIADGSALAATRRLGYIYQGLTYQAQQGYTLTASDVTAIQGAASNVALNNKAAQMNIVLNTNDIIIGRWHPEWSPPGIEPRLDQPDAVKVISRRDGTANGPITTFFAKIMGINTINVSATATAALTSQSNAGPGGLPVPFGISKYWFDNQPLFNFCNQPIRFYPTNDPSSCAGWNVYDRYLNMNDNNLRNLLNDLRNGVYQSPEVTANQVQFEFGSGTMSTQTYDAMRLLFLASRNTDLDGDGINDAWRTSVAVYDAADCGATNGLITIVGFATIVITGVQSPPVHQIDGYVECNYVVPARGGGGQYGTKGSIPGLVQ